MHDLKKKFQNSKGVHNYPADTSNKMELEVIIENRKRRTKELVSSIPIKIIRTELLQISESSLI